MNSAAPPPRPAADHWRSPWSPAVDEEESAAGRRRVRLLHQMRCELPLPEAVVAATRSIRVEPFADDDAVELLEVNNRAFAWHPDQGGWTLERLHERQQEPWFDPADLLIHRSGAEGEQQRSGAGRIDGFCWTKVHPELPADVPGGPRPAAGEIFVIAADPDTHGTGLGRALTVAGLQHLSAKGLALGMLYVEADNGPAIALYERLGFRVHHSDAGYAPLLGSDR